MPLTFAVPSLLVFSEINPKIILEILDYSSRLQSTYHVLIEEACLQLIHNVVHILVPPLAQVITSIASSHNKVEHKALNKETVPKIA